MHSTLAESSAWEGCREQQAAPTKQNTAKQNKRPHHILLYHRTFLVSHTLSSRTLRLLLHKLISTPQPLIVILQPGDILCTALHSLDWNKGIHLPKQHQPLHFLWTRWFHIDLPSTHLSQSPLPVCKAWMSVLGVSFTTHKVIGFMFYSEIEIKFFHASNSSCQHKAILSISLLCTCPCKLSTEQFMPMIYQAFFPNKHRTERNHCMVNVVERGGL